MKKMLITGVLLLAALFLAGAQQGYAYQQVTSTPDGGCLNCHPTTAGTGLHTVSAHTNCASCHPGSVYAKNVMTSACIVCHPNAPDTPGKCNLINFPAHPTSGVQSCLGCHSTCAPATCIDADNDTFGANCPAGPDCDDTDNTTHEGCSCIDNDGDGYGDNCTLGPDCNDNDNATHDDCEIDCNLTIRPKTFSPLRALLLPFQFFTIRADRNSSISFTNPVCIFWESEGIDDVIKIRLGEKLIIGYVRVWASHLTAGDFKVYVTFGDTDETQCGPITVKGGGASSFIQDKRVKPLKSCGN
jgi:hypothetical protein